MSTWVDGISYRSAADAPDLGSLRCVGGTGLYRHYFGLSTDAGKLPHYVLTGSTCYMADTGDLYVYEKTTDTWYKQ